MSNLIKAFDSYGDFNRNTYFVITFDALGSKIMLEVPLESTKANLKQVLEVMDLSNNGFELVLKNWNTEDSNNADFVKDFPEELLFKSIAKKSLIWVSVDDDTLFIDFRYDCKDSDLEKFIVGLNDKVRKKFALSRAPSFKVLTKSHSEFDTKEIRSEVRSFNIAENYNDDFQKISDKIGNAIEKKESGLILLYGQPGTGKTTYIKCLLSKYQEHNFIFIQNEFVTNLLEPEFISFLLKQRNSILVIEDAEKVIISRENLKAGSVVSTLLQLTDGLFSDFLNIKVVCTFNTNLSKIDTALLRKGRLIAMYEFKPLSIEKTNNLLSSIGAEKVDSELSLAEIYNIEQETYSNITKKKIGF